MMAIGPRLDIRLGQSLVMTPQLQQAIKLLQMSNLEVVEFVEQELETNPLLERPENEAGEPATPETADNSDNSDSTSDAVEAGGDLAEPDSLSDFEDGQDLSTGDLAVDAEVSDLYSEDGSSDAPVDVVGDGMGMTEIGGGGGSFADDNMAFDATLSKEETLKDHLSQQINLLIEDPIELIIAADMLDYLDDGGYFREDLGLIAARLGIEVCRVESVLKRLQTLDPSGVFARDLSECFAAQLHELDRLDPAMALFLDNLDLLAKQDLPAMMSACSVDEEDIRDMIQEIRNLNPKPGAAFEHDVAEAVIPDVYVREAPDGTWSVELNTETLPRVLVNARYFASVKGRAKDKTERTYLNECLNTANWLVKSLDQRARTILKVSVELVRQQDGFFAHGVTHLKPLNLRAIADAIEMHESTVSRVTANKYMATPRGIFELKYFFTSAISSSSGGESHSAEAVRHRIRDLIQAETLGKVLSDDKLVEILRESNIDIARRTVAKYREAMGISSSVQRRRQLKMKAKVIS